MSVLTNWERRRRRRSGRAGGRLREARVTYEQALEIAPRHRDARRKLLQVRRQERLESRRSRAR